MHPTRPPSAEVLMHPLGRIRVHVALGLLVVTLLVPAAARAQDAERAHSLEPGAWALQFSIGGNFRLESFNGSTISLKRHSSARSAWQLGLSPSFGSAQEKRTIGPSDSITVMDRDSDTAGLEIDLNYTRYPRPGRTMNLFWTLGPEVSWSRGSQSEVGFEASDRAWSVGLGAKLGAEWFATKTLSVHAAYGAGFSYRSFRVTEEFEGAPERTVEFDSWTIGGRSVQFGASVYL
jgi:hypothetical protein